MATSTPQPPSPGAPATPVKKGTSPWVWVLAGCGGLLFIGAVVVTVVVYWGYHKAKGFAEAAKKNPAVFAAKLVIAAQPDLEVVSEDTDKGTLTIRNKKTGEVITMDAEEIKEGRLKFKNEKGEEVTFEGSGEPGKEGFTVKSNEGTMTFGKGGEQTAPSWVPSYPGTTPVTTMSKSSDEGIYGNYTFQTSDSSEKVLEYYETELKGDGFTVEKTNVQGGPISMGTLHAKRDDGKRNVDISILPAAGLTQVTVQYTTSGGVKD